MPPTNATTHCWRPGDVTADSSVLDVDSDGGGGRVTMLAGRLSLACVAFFMAVYSFGWACVPSILNAELFPQPVRSVAASTCSFVGLTSGAACSYVYGPLASWLGDGPSFAVLAAINLTGSLFAAVTLPETKGKSLEDIDEMLGGHDGQTAAAEADHVDDVETGRTSSTNDHT